MKRIHRAWGKILHIGKNELSKHNYIALKSYTNWVEPRSKIVKLPYPWEPSMSVNLSKSHIAFVPEEDVLKETIKALEKENANLRSNLGKLIRE